MNKKKKGPKSLIPDSVANPKHKQAPTLLTPIENQIFGFSSRDESPHVNLKYLDTGYQCLSAWSPQELKALSAFINKVTNLSWPEIIRSGGSSGNKAGLGYTIHKNREVLPKTSKLDEISPDLSFFELRVSQRARVHGFRAASAFFLVWLDKDHQVYKQ